MENRPQNAAQFARTQYHTASAGNMQHNIFPNILILKRFWRNML